MDKPQSNLDFRLMSFNDHHIKEEDAIMAKLTGTGLFQLSSKGEKVYNFAKVVA